MSDARTPMADACKNKIAHSKDNESHGTKHLPAVLAFESMDMLYTAPITPMTEIVVVLLSLSNRPWTITCMPLLSIWSRRLEEFCFALSTVLLVIVIRGQLSRLFGSVGSPLFLEVIGMHTIASGVADGPALVETL